MIPKIAVNSDARRARGLAMEHEILAWLPLNGSPIRSEDLFAKAEKKRISRNTVLRVLKKAQSELLVIRHEEIVGGRLAVFYGLNILRLLPFDREALLELLGREGEWTSLARKQRGPFRTKKGLEWYLRSNFTLLVVALDEILLRAADVDKEDAAEVLTEGAVDHLLRRWLNELASVMFVCRPNSKVALQKAARPLLNMVDRLLEDGLEFPGGGRDAEKPQKIVEREKAERAAARQKLVSPRSRLREMSSRTKRRGEG